MSDISFCPTQFDSNVNVSFQGPVLQVDGGNDTSDEEEDDDDDDNDDNDDEDGDDRDEFQNDVEEVSDIILCWCI